MNVDRDRFMLQIATGSVKEAPFSEEAPAGVRRILGEFFDVPEREQAVEEGQCMRLGFISGILRALCPNPPEVAASVLVGVKAAPVVGAMPLQGGGGIYLTEATSVYYVALGVFG